MTLRYLPIFFLFCCFQPLTAQDCDYQIVLLDLVDGDGWNGGQLTVRAGSRSLEFTLGSGNRQSVYFPVTNGETVALDYQRGVAPAGTSFVVLDNDDNVVAEATSPPTGSDVATFTANCTACAAPPANSIDFFRARFNSVDVRFRPAPAATDPSYLIRYGTGGFDPSTGEGEALTTTGSPLRIEELETNQDYNFWIATLCGASSDTSSFRGPYRVRTEKEADVGITLIESPATGCALGSEPVTIGITNYGGAPQQFFNVGFAVNGEEVMITRPQDGIFTGIVTVDSTEFFTFDAPADFSEPGEYKITAFTILEGDEDKSNDTLTLTVVNQGTVTEYPYVEDFEADNGLWITERAGRGPISWDWGMPRGEFIDRAPQGRRSWVTNLFGDYFADETSYLVSPCFDLSGMSEDPYFSCLLQMDTETDVDDFYLEMSTDGGENFARVDISPADLNWYNDRADRVWEGDGGFSGGPVLVANTLSGAAGRTVQLRFVFSSGGLDTREGVLIDAVRISERPMRDVAIVDRSSDDPVTCDAAMGYSFDVRYQNLGTEVVDTVTIGYTATSGRVVDTTVVGAFAPGNIATVTFSADPDNQPSADLTSVFATTPRDMVPENDEAAILLGRAFELPFLEDFEDGLLPERWEVEDDFAVVNSDPLGSSAVVGTVAAGDSISLRTAFYAGPYLSTDSLRFRLDLTAGADVEVDVRVTLVSCDAPTQELLLTNVQDAEYFMVLDAPLDAGYFEFTVSARGGEATVALDDIGIRRCPPTLFLEQDVIPTSNAGTATDGRITITPNRGVAPYTYAWSNGATTRTVAGLTFGDYTVTVTDHLGCTDTKTIALRNFLDVDDPEGILRSLQLAPNPTDGQVRVALDLAAPDRVAIEVYDATGRRVLVRELGRRSEVNERLDLGGSAAGVYLVRVRAGSASRAVRIIRR